MKDCDVVKMSKCFWCGENKNELVIPTKQDRKWCDNKSMSVIVNYDPCDKCKEEFSVGTHVIEVSETPLTDSQPPIQEGVYPTHNMWVIKKEFAESIFKNDSSTVLVNKEIAKAIGLYDVKPNAEGESNADNS